MLNCKNVYFYTIKLWDKKSADKSPQQPSKSLEELFKKTAASPSIYWKPLSEEQIKERIELRNKVDQDTLIN